MTSYANPETIKQIAIVADPFFMIGYLIGTLTSARDTTDTEMRDDDLDTALEIVIAYREHLYAEIRKPGYMPPF